LRANRCDRSFRWVNSAAGVSAETQGPPIWERSVDPLFLFFGPRLSLLFFRRLHRCPVATRFSFRR
jgi:hypothetical protein